ncbi:MAG: hypothetical protein FP814_07250 [Desulfobacterium sp.]|nr:hypothetical protein [Desulfobacterium sp.]MBU3948885.1 hypothetical protein [Pseudomonadota bacterium]MBU4036472.1 hypothetical protein [Pseudomonadota bacterium]
MPFNNFVKHPNRHAGPDPVSRIQWDYWFPAFAGMTKVEFSSFLHVYEIQMRLPFANGFCDEIFIIFTGMRVNRL